jgi:hypothetical protein
MGEPDYRHLGRHHGVGGGGHLLQRLEQHLPEPREHPHGEFFCHGLPACALVGRHGGVLDGGGRDLEDRHPMRDLRQVTQHHGRVGPIGVLRA